MSNFVSSGMPYAITVSTIIDHDHTYNIIFMIDFVTILLNFIAFFLIIIPYDDCILAVHLILYYY